MVARFTLTASQMSEVMSQLNAERDMRRNRIHSVPVAPAPSSRFGQYGSQKRNTSVQPLVGGLR